MGRLFFVLFLNRTFRIESWLVIMGVKPRPCLVCYFSSFPHSLHHIKYTKRHMFGILNVDEIKN
jgi:hypothetical protein